MFVFYSNFLLHARVAPLQPQQSMDDPGGGGGGGRGGVVERGDVRKGFAPSSTINQNQTAASEAALLSDATLDAGAERAFGYMPTMTSASGLGSKESFSWQFVC